MSVRDVSVVSSRGQQVHTTQTLYLTFESSNGSGISSNETFTVVRHSEQSLPVLLRYLQPPPPNITVGISFQVSVRVVASNELPVAFETLQMMLLPISSGAANASSSPSDGGTLASLQSIRVLDGYGVSDLNGVATWNVTVRGQSA